MAQDTMPISFAACTRYDCSHWRTRSDHGISLAVFMRETYSSAPKDAIGTLDEAGGPRGDVMLLRCRFGIEKSIDYVRNELTNKISILE